VHGSDTTIICEGCVCVPKGTWVFAHRCMYDSMKALCGVKQHTLCCRLMVDSARTLHGVAVRYCSARQVSSSDWNVGVCRQEKCQHNQAGIDHAVSVTFLPSCFL